MTRSLFKSLGWAIFLACSWTWCIGMFLPVLLARDYGVWGWIVFAVPNVIGAAAMGWILRSREQSESMVVEHRPMLWAFSFITVSFQIFFALWIFGRLGSNLIEFALATLALGCVVSMLPAGRRPRLMLAAAVIVLAVSCVCIARTRSLGQCVSPAIWFHNAARPPMDILWLTPVCTLGFLLCPYLDLTFHNARQHLSKTESRFAFTLGFGLFFLAMILFTLAYATPVLIRLAGLQLSTRDIFGWWIEVHLCVQLAFTIGAHVNAATAGHDRVLSAHRVGFFLAAVMVGFGAALLAFLLNDGERIYRMFMAFYGLVFPAYVWLCMTPTRTVSRPLTRLSHHVWIMVLLVTAPMYWMGFIRGQMAWLVPGVAIVLLARLAFLRRRPAALIAAQIANDIAAGQILE